MPAVEKKTVFPMMWLRKKNMLSLDAGVLVRAPRPRTEYAILTDGRAGGQALDVGLRQGQERSVDHGDEGQHHERWPEHLRSHHAKGQHGDPDQDVDGEIGVDGEQPRNTGGVLSMDRRHPDVEWDQPPASSSDQQETTREHPLSEAHPPSGRAPRSQGCQSGYRP